MRAESEVRGDEVCGLLVGGREVEGLLVCGEEDVLADGTEDRFEPDEDAGAVVEAAVVAEELSGAGLEVES